MKKEWTIKNQVIGTHHSNRQGEFVDFRPSEGVIVDERHINSDNKGDIQKVSLVVLPPKGQKKVSRVVIPTENSERLITSRDEEKGTEWVKYRFFAHFLGQEISAEFNGGEEWFDLQKKEEGKREFRRFSKKSNLFREEVERFASSISGDQIADFPHDRRVLGRYLAGRYSIEKILSNTIDDMVIEKFGKDNLRELDWRRKAEIVKKFINEGVEEKILEVEKKKKEAKKQAWLSKQRFKR